MEQVQIVRPLIEFNIFILMIDITTMEFYNYKLILDMFYIKLVLKCNYNKAY